MSDKVKAILLSRLHKAFYDGEITDIEYIEALNVLNPE